MRKRGLPRVVDYDSGSYCPNQVLLDYLDHSHLRAKGHTLGDLLEDHPG